MQSFKNFITEDRQNPLYVEVDSRLIENNKDAMNADFDRLTSMPYQNPIVFYNQLRGTLERYGMIIPPAATRHFLNFDAELTFKLGDSDLFLYVVFNTHKNTKVEAYAQVVDETELAHLMDSEDPREEIESEDEEENEEEEKEDEKEDEEESEDDEEKEDESEEEEDEDEDKMPYMEKYRKRMDDDG